MNDIFKNNNIIVIFNSSFVIENKIYTEYKDNYNIIKINIYDINNNILINQFIENTSLFNKNEKILIITDINNANNKRLNEIIKKCKKFNKKLILFGNSIYGMEVLK